MASIVIGAGLGLVEHPVFDMIGQFAAEPGIAMFATRDLEAPMHEQRGLVAGH